LSAYYVVDSNTRSSFTVTTTDDLSGLVGNELIGVHQLDSLHVSSGGNIDMGGDRLAIEDVFFAPIDPGSVQNADPSSTLP
jgi:hypothetical protein